jgi:hypothetical protein
MSKDVVLKNGLLILDYLKFHLIFPNYPISIAVARFLCNQIGFTFASKLHKKDKAISIGLIEISNPLPCQR